MSDKRLTVKEIADKYHVSYQSVYIAVLKKRLKAHRKGNRWFITDKEMLEYQASKYGKEMSRYNGELTFDPEKKELAISQAAKLFGINANAIYYKIRKNKLPAIKKGCTLVVNYDDCMAIFGENPKQIRFA